MKDLTLLVLMGQLGLSVALPLVGFIVLAVWLRDSFGWGSWVVLLGTLLGLITAIDGLVHILKTMARVSKGKKKEDPPALSFNDHD